MDIVRGLSFSGTKDLVVSTTLRISSKRGARDRSAS